MDCDIQIWPSPETGWKLEKDCALAASGMASATTAPVNAIANFLMRVPLSASNYFGKAERLPMVMTLKSGNKGDGRLFSPCRYAPP
jgi:hypothetical protein